MFENKSVAYKIAVISNLVCIAIGILLSIITIVDKSSVPACQICCIINVYSLLFAGYYIFAGYKKNAAKLYKVYAFLYAVSEAVFLYYVSMQNKYLLTFLSALALSATLVLLLSKNLGKTVSFIVCAALLILAAGILAFSIFALDNYALSQTVIVFAIMASLYYILTDAKYQDKASRGAE